MRVSGWVFRRTPESDMIVENGLRLHSYVLDLPRKGVIG
jgi:hypothetical protein